MIDNAVQNNSAVPDKYSGRLTGKPLTPVLNRRIPPPRVLHPCPDARFYASHPS
jgi:hypothetical protein